jgi:hypothetical protein
MKPKKLKIVMPSSMSEITLGRYQEFIKSTENDAMSDDEIAVKMLDVFLDIKQTDTMKLTLESMTQISTKLAEVLSEKPTLIQRFKMGDTEFGFVPKLDDMTFGEYIDLDTYIADWETMNNAMAVLFRPIKVKKGNKYTLYDYEGDLYHDAMKQMPLSACMGALIFFYRLEKELKTITKTYSLEEGNQTHSEESGVGINQSIN